MKFKEINIKNRRATFDYAIGDTFTAGIVLTGTEIKSVRLGKASLVDTFCYVDRGEVWVKNMYIAEYFYGTYNNHLERRDRKLLLNRKEIRQLEKEGKESGFTIVPLRLFINDRGLARALKTATTNAPWPAPSINKPATTFPPYSQHATPLFGLL